MTAQPMPQQDLSDLSTPSNATLLKELELLVRQMIEQTTENPAPPLHALPEEFDHEVLLDLEVDGVRCLLLRQPLHPDLPAEPAVMLSPRELEIARMIAKGYPNKIIAAVLEISAWTVCTHIRRIFAKLGVGSRAAMVARLSEDGALTEKLPDDRKAGAFRAHVTHA